jgi:hypothetical protein
MISKTPLGTFKAERVEAMAVIPGTDPKFPWGWGRHFPTSLVCLQMKPRRRSGPRGFFRHICLVSDRCRICTATLHAVLRYRVQLIVGRSFTGTPEDAWNRDPMAVATGSLSLPGGFSCRSQPPLLGLGPRVVGCVNGPWSLGWTGTGRLPRSTPSRRASGSPDERQDLVRAFHTTTTSILQ